MNSKAKLCFIISVVLENNPVKCLRMDSGVLCFGFIASRDLRNLQSFIIRLALVCVNNSKYPTNTEMTVMGIRLNHVRGLYARLYHQCIHCLIFIGNLQENASFCFFKMFTLLVIYINPCILVLLLYRVPTK